MTIEPVAPMLAVPGELPPESRDAEWGYEFKWDGVRTMVRISGGSITAWNRRGIDITVRYPEVQELAAAEAGSELLLDGEFVAFDERGRPRFERVAHRIHVSDPREIRQVSARIPVSYMIFDLLNRDGESLIAAPYTERREILESLGLAGPRWMVPPSFAGHGNAVQQASLEQGLEGVVAKRLASTYQPGRRSSDWLKIVNFFTQEVVIGGWHPGGGQLSGSMGSLMMGMPHPDGLRYVGDVGTGFTDKTRTKLLRQLKELERPTSPFDEVPQDRSRDARWVEPVLVAEVRYRNWTEDGRLRTTSWRGLRDDKVPADLMES